MKALRTTRRFMFELPDYPISDIVDIDHHQPTLAGWSTSAFGTRVKERRWILAPGLSK
jgi:hypothetical protein